MDAAHLRNSARFSRGSPGEVDRHGRVDKAHQDPECPANTCITDSFLTTFLCYIITITAEKDARMCKL